ncbi:cobalamin-dependent protein [Candidatus Woesearchaeota archaeon]|nr:cobalamin-dependent protein [Candidatus Woesearchaeota archaeon]
MRIQFINPLLGGDYSALDIAITSLATYLNERTKHRATILDFTFHRRHWKKHLHKWVRQDKPHVIGMSSNTMYMQYIKTIAKEIKKHYRIPIILGGYHASQYPDETLNIKEIDAVCIGDGEYALTEYLSKSEQKKPLKGIKGIWAKNKNRIIKNQGGCFIKEINELPIPNWDLWKDLDKYLYYLGMIYFIGTRGCIYKCSNCDAIGIKNSVEGSYYRIRDPVDYAHEIKHQYEKYKNRGLRLAQLFDQIPTIDYNWLRKFCDEYIKLKMNKKLKYSMFSRIDHLNEEKLRILGKSGCALLRAGIETGDESLRKKIFKKNISNAKIKKIFRIAKRYNVGFTAFYILGNPGDNKKTINKTIKFAQRLDANRSAFFVYKPFTKESIEQIIMHGGEIDKKRWEKADNIIYKSVIKLKGLSPREIEFLQKKAYFVTFGKRLIKMIKTQKIKYFTRLFNYVIKGLKDGLDPAYLLPYYHIYGYDNIDN